MIFWNQFVQCRRKQGVLTAMLTFDVGHKAITSLGGDDRILVVTCLACFVTLSAPFPCTPNPHPTASPYRWAAAARTAPGLSNSLNTGVTIDRENWGSRHRSR